MGSNATISEMEGAGSVTQRKKKRSQKLLKKRRNTKTGQTSAKRTK